MLSAVTSRGAICVHATSGLRPIASKRGVSFRGDISRLNHFFPALRFADKEFGELGSVARDHIEADVVELFLDLRRFNRGRDFGLKFGSHICRQALGRRRRLPGIDHKVGNARLGGGRGHPAVPQRVYRP